MPKHCCLGLTHSKEDTHQKKTENTKLKRGINKLFGGRVDFILQTDRQQKKPYLIHQFANKTKNNYNIYLHRRVSYQKKLLISCQLRVTSKAVPEHPIISFSQLPYLLQAVVIAESNQHIMKTAF